MKRKFWLRICGGIVCAGLSGCAYDMPAVEIFPERERVTISRELEQRVRAALVGHPEEARRYAGLYEALALCAENSRYPWKMARDIEADVVQAREILELKHGERPEFTRVVTEHLTTLSENVELTEAKRREWHARLRELAEACRRGGR